MTKHAEHKVLTDAEDEARARLDKLLKTKAAEQGRDGVVDPAFVDKSDKEILAAAKELEDAGKALQAFEALNLGLNVEQTQGALVEDEN